MTQSAIEAFKTLCASFSDDDANALAMKVASELDVRADFEKSKNSDNDSIQKHIKSARAALASASVARVMLACNLSVSYFNASERVNARRNIYAIQKVASLLRVFSHSEQHNAINNAALRSLFAFERESLTFTHEDALCAASNKVSAKDAKKRKALSRHTVSQSTASTQASSTMSALVACNVVSEARDENNASVYRLNDNALVSALRESMSA